MSESFEYNVPLTEHIDKLLAESDEERAGEAGSHSKGSSNDAPGAHGTEGRFFFQYIRTLDSSIIFVEVVFIIKKKFM